MKVYFSGLGALMFVLIIMLAMYLQVMSILGTTTASRQISGRYIMHASFYDLALSNSEKVLFLLQQEIDKERITANTYQRINDTESWISLEAQADFKDGEYRLDSYFTQLFKEEMDKAIEEYLTENFGQDAYGRYISYSLDTATGTYHVRTYFRVNESRVHSQVYKIADGKSSTVHNVYGNITWQDFTHQVAVSPIYNEEVADYIGFNLEMLLIEDITPQLTEIQYVSN